MSCLSFESLVILITKYKNYKIKENKTKKKRGKKKVSLVKYLGGYNFLFKPKPPDWKH